MSAVDPLDPIVTPKWLPVSAGPMLLLKARARRAALGNGALSARTLTRFIMVPWVPRALSLLRSLWDTPGLKILIFCRL